jgi:hypothetical protein
MPISIHKNYVYKKDGTAPEDQSLDLFLPSDVKERPPLLVCILSSLPTSSPSNPHLPILFRFLFLFLTILTVLVVHGGLWLDRDKARYEHIGSHFAGQGMPLKII